MLTRTRRAADVQIIFISDDELDADYVSAALDRSGHRIYFTSHSSNPSNMIAIWRTISLDRPFLPTAIIIDYFCDGGRCEDMMRDVRRMVEESGVELIVHNAPDGEETRDALMALGADSIIRAEALCGELIVVH